MFNAETEMENNLTKNCLLENVHFLFTQFCSMLSFLEFIREGTPLLIGLTN